MGCPKISVIIPAFNRACCVPKAIESVLGQHFKPFEVIVIDDGSTDDTPAVLQAYGNSIRVLRQPNQGVSAARNQGISAATGDWIAFLDSDDEWCPGKLERQMLDLESFPTAVAHECNGVYLGGDNPPTELFALRGYRQTENPAVLPRAFGVLLQHNITMLSSFVVRRDIALRAAGFDAELSLYEDLAFMLKVSLEGPIVTNRDILTRFIRRKEDHNIALTVREKPNKQAHLDRLQQVLQRLFHEDHLTEEERILARQAASNTSFELALQFTETQKTGIRIRHLWQSWKLAPTPKNTLRCLLGVMPFGIGVRLYGAYRQRKECTSP